MSIFYFENENGPYFSADGKRRFIRLRGKEAYDYLKLHKADKKCFEQTVTDEVDGERVFVEVPKRKEKEFKKWKSHDKYVAKCKREYPRVFVSLSQLLDEEESLTIEETVSDGESVEDKAIHEIELEMLRRAIKTLSNDELLLVHSLFLAETPVTQDEFAGTKKQTQSTISKAKKRVLKKLFRFF